MAPAHRMLQAGLKAKRGGNHNETWNKEKNFIFYELNTSVVEEVMLWLSGLKETNSSKEDSAE